MEIEGKKYSNEEIVDIIELEGLDYTVQSYIDAEKIEDEDMKNYFKQAKYWLDKIDESLKNYEW